MNSTASRHLVTSKGHSCVTVLGDIEAVTLLRAEGSTFALELHSKASKHGLSHDQLVWAHTLAMKYIEKNDKTKAKNTVKTPDITDASKISGYLKTALDSGIKRPKLRMVVRDSENEIVTQVVLTLLEDGSVRITDKHISEYSSKFGVELKVYYGKLTTEGDLVGGRRCNGLLESLQALAHDPEGTARLYGQITGQCCFCGRELTDKRSIAASYGPVCADRYGLSWGEK